MVYVLLSIQRDSTKKRQEQCDENKIEKMTMTTMKGSLGDAFIKRTDKIQRLGAEEEPQ